MVNSEEFSKRLKEMFDYYDLTASSFADKIDVGRASISHILSGRNKPSLDFVMRVVSNFDEVELYWLLNGKGQFPSQSSQNDLSRKEPNVLKNEPNLENKDSKSEVAPVSKSLGKEVYKVIICYTDGSFESFDNIS